MTGVLQGIAVLEMGGVGPVPFCGMVLADHGARVIQLRRRGAPTTAADPALSPLNRSRVGVAIDLKDPRGRQLVRRLAARCDALIEGFRPGVMERLDLAPQQLIETINPRLVVGRMTGWGQQGPLARTAGHDINYLALSGTLDMLGRAGEPPTPPVNLLGDFGGGGLLLAFAVVAAILRAQRSGQGQVIDCAIVDGAALLAAIVWGFEAQGRWRWQRGSNFLDGGAHYYGTYRCADGKFLAVGALEPDFYQEFIERLGCDASALHDGRTDQDHWARMRELVAAAIAGRTRDEWCRVFADSDACVTPVLTPEEALVHPHNLERGTFARVAGRAQPAPAPRFSVDGPPAPDAERPADEFDELLYEAGLTETDIAALRRDGVLA
ncbi:MAG: CaiB/BaiF CoA-transferase family protein [Steroidobacteraceae bacterium]|nr:CoA transferase [Nevskiaceae bacterium]MCP5339842.1 CoA transferase [Nevskiaceae bacterium]MCP5359782.1 CoA transferase [Nevskiaceae bacterium]MCP5467421.1 CoA transferase [Nevskiaceae bacterium]MCP5472728.1 CoA transferase [Nevskiaceae bacterium]